MILASLLVCCKEYPTPSNSKTRSRVQSLFTGNLRLGDVVQDFVLQLYELQERSTSGCAECLSCSDNHPDCFETQVPMCRTAAGLGESSFAQYLSCAFDKMRQAVRAAPISTRLFYTPTSKPLRLKSKLKPKLNDKKTSESRPSHIQVTQFSEVWFETSRNC